MSLYVGDRLVCTLDGHLHTVTYTRCGIVIYSYSTTNKMHLLSQIIYSCKTLYMFRTFFPSIIRSSKLRIQQRYISNSCCYLLWFTVGTWWWQCYWSWSGQPRPIALLPPRSNGKPEAATAVVELLMMGMRMPETCWAVFKQQVINLRNCCI
jgi:hypothetical protein